MPSQWSAGRLLRSLFGFRARDLWVFVLAFAFLLAVGLAAMNWRSMMGLGASPELNAIIVGLLLLALAPARATRAAWHLFANTVGVEPPSPLRKVWVLDGDTIDDVEAGVRYRLANIDAPETGDNAKCFLERQRGEQAKWAAVRLVRAAKQVCVRKTFRTDHYGRRIAFVLIDGRDLGEALVELGLARPWRGSRELWCGPRGGLARIARSGARPHKCKTCRRWR